MGADLGNVSTRFEDTSSSSSSDLGSVSTGVVRVVDKIIGSSVIPRRNVVDVKSVPVIEKFSSPNIVKPSISVTPISSGGMFTPSPEELQAMTAQNPDNLAQTKKADDGTSDLKRTSGGGDNFSSGLSWSQAFGIFYLIVGALGIFVIHKVIKAVKK